MINFNQDNINEIISNINKNIWIEYDINQDMDLYLKEFKQLIDNELGGLPISIVIPDINTDKWFTKIYRARCFSEIKNFNLRSEYSYTPTSLCKKTQRANLAFNPVFYASDNPITCMTEIFDRNQSVTKKFCLTTWKINETARFKVSPFLFDSIDSSNIYRTLSDSILEKIPSKLGKDLSSTEIENTIKSLKFFSELFVQPEKYSISSFLAHHYLYADSLDRTDILIYPSVQADRKGVNFAINPNFVDDNMTLDRIYIISVNFNNCSVDQINFTFEKYGLMKNSMINWYNVLENDTVFLDLLNDDFERFIEKNTLKYNNLSH